MVEVEGRLGRTADGASERGDDTDVARSSEAFSDENRERLERADRLAAIGTLAAGLAHDIRNPLVSVRTFLQLLPERLDDEEFCTNFRELALGEIDRICTLINDLLSFSRPAPPDRELTDLAVITGQMVRLLEAEARSHEVTLSCVATTEPVRVVADDAQIRQVVMNVVLNGIEACTGRGAVVVATHFVTTTDGRTWAVVEVRDEGRGLTESDRARMFEPFYTTKSLGSGLGLFIARRIVVDHGGDLEARPGEHGGTVFSIRLPAEPERGDDGPA
jgi:signal transduction histidine kinase